MPRFFPRFSRYALKGIRVQRAFPVLFVALVLPSDRRRERTTPLLCSSVKSLAGITSLFIPQIPIPDTSKLKETLLNALPSWTTKSATSRFIRRPQADIVVGISLEMRQFVVTVAYYPKGEDIIVRSSGDDEDEEIGWVDLRRPSLDFVGGWGRDPLGDSDDTSLNHSTIRYTTSYPHEPIGLGHSLNQSTIKRWDTERDYFFVHIEDFIFSDEGLVPNSGNKPSTFAPSKRQVMTDFARLLRERVESFIATDILDKATIVNDSPVVKYMVAYPDILDGVNSEPGAMCIRDFTIAFKDAGFPLLDSDIQPLSEGDDDTDADEVFLKDVATSYQMVEFLSVGLTGLIGYASLLPINPHIPAIPKERPFVTVVDDESYFTSRLCLMTNDSRFGVVQQPACYPIRSPVFKQLPDEHLTLLINTFVKGGLMNMFVQEGQIYTDPGVWQRLMDEIPELDKKLALHTITAWPENRAFDDVIDVLRRRLDKNFVELESFPMPPPEGDDMPHTVSASCVAFAKMVEQAVRTATFDSLDGVFDSAPWITDVAMFDTGRGEADVYTALFDLIYIPKSLPAINVTKISGSGSQPEPTDADSAEPPPMQNSQISPDEHVFESLDWAKFAKKAHEDPQLQVGLTTKDMDYIDHLAKIRQSVDHDKYYKMRVVRPQDNGLSVPLGMSEAINSELARIYLDALRV
ncbi:hypothetical protein Dda_3310 [Drechslerella dactyloides]|uniref:Uncharacterized protein n=1 Tax=Drechslerella dactyloides TaxID=74499 RepID=A0AAD6J3F4_DREDA|nr:hypothetical protein Dda_3310 [Drechslerella dactyloides]